MGQDCFLYVRVSDDSQEDGFSIAYQTRVLSEYAEREKLNIVNIYTEVQTAAKAGRPQFLTMAAALKAKDGPKIVLVDTTDRLTRNDDDKAIITKLIERNGVAVHFVRKGSVWNQKSSPDDNFIQDIEVAIAKRYISHLRQETRKGIVQRIRSGGWCGQAPHGYQNDKLKKLIVIDEAEAPFVKRAFELFASGTESIITLRERLFLEGYIFTARFPKISKSQLHLMLKQPAYVGQIGYEGKIYQAQHEPLIPMEQFKRVQYLLDGRGGKRGERNFLYQGLLFCEACGGMMSGELKKNKYILYRCWKSANGGVCQQKYVNQKVIDAAVADTFNSIVLPDDWRQVIKEAMRRFSKFKRVTESNELHRLDKEQLRLNDKIDKAYEDYQDGVIDRAYHEKIKKRYEQQLLAINEARAKVSKVGIDIQPLTDMYFELPKMISRVWISGFESERAELLKMLTSNIFVKDKQARVELASPFNYFYNDIIFNKKYPSQDKLRTLLESHGHALSSLYQKLCA